ncbi:phage head morphogenesis protein [Sphingomonas sp. SFZ2018-12]|uniref:phage head morphogenesis protein n=1 Tax=Sphingomonas sp. SFZ2018-12 TaxID=2683197 RepID=UPI001F0D3FC9|nr:phage minor head protein [Sphingomonas sp. SFZ2018-12]MCH4893420.1 phage head morphogenesis protein [Sphingomonas sp. SFZ2018-12]
MPDPLGYSIFLEPTDAVRAFQARGELKPTVRWSEMMHENHASAFTVAKIARLDLLRTIQASLDEQIRDGGSFDRWKTAILPELQRAGWWGAVQNRELTGTDERIVVNERRLRVIYNTNIRMSLAAGHWARIQRQKAAFPYLRYVPSTSERKRQLHIPWYGIVLPVDHPWWQTHFPPNGWGCKCGFEQVTQRRLERMGWSVTPDDQLPPGNPTIFVAATGQAFDVPQGIDPGFSYNPGTAHLRVMADKAAASIIAAADAGLDAAARQTLREIVDDAAFEQFLALPEASFPVALLTVDQQALISAKARLVVLPTAVYRKQRGEAPEISRGHPELTVANYRLLPDIVDRAIVIAQQGDSRLIYFADEGGRLWKVVVRQDAGEPLPAVVSFHASRPRNMTAETRTLTILLDRRGT